MAGNKKSTRKPAGVRRALQTSTPVLIRYSSHDDQRLKTEPYIRLEDFNRREGSMAAWVTISFRLTVGLKFALLFFNTEAEELLIRAVSATCDVKDRYARMDSKWGMSKEEIELIREALRITDEMQDKTTRKEQLATYLAVDKLFKLGDKNEQRNRP